MRSSGRTHDAQQARPSGRYGPHRLRPAHRPAGPAAGFGLAPAGPASAQAYPTRPVKMIVPLPAGSAPDVRHRLIGQALTQLWGQQIVVENRPGGGGIIGTRAALGEQPDGYTL